MERRSLATSIVLFIISQQLVQIATRCVVDDVSDGFAGSGLSAGQFNNTTTPSQCGTSCRELNYTALAIEDGQWCWCYSASDETIMAASSDCFSFCPTGEVCGGSSGELTFDVLPSGTEIVATSTVVSPMVLNSAGEATFTASGEIFQIGAVFLLDKGDESPIWESVGTTLDGNRTILSRSLSYTTPGIYNVRLAAKLTTTITTEWYNWPLEVQEPAAFESVTCPPAVELGAIFYCLAVVRGAKNKELVISFNENSSNQSLLIPMVDWLIVGKTPPVVPTPDHVTLTGGSTRFLLRQPITHAGRVYSLQWLGGSTGVCTMKVVSPQCSVSGHSYCISDNVCSPDCPTVAGAYSRCPVTAPSLCTTKLTCSNSGTTPGDCAATSNVTYTELSYSVLFNAVASTVGTHLITTDVKVQPGNLIQITCSSGSIAYVTANPGDADILADSQSHLIKATIAPTEPLAIAHRCTAVPSIVSMLLQVPPTVLQDMQTVACQKPIGKLTLTAIQNNNTLAFYEVASPEVDYFGTMLVNLNSDCVLRAVLDSGGPINLTFSFDHPTMTNFSRYIDRLVNSTELLDETLVMTESGTYLVQIEAFNLLANRSQATVKLLAQYPIVEDWQLLAPEIATINHWLNYVDVNLQLILPESQRLPTDAKLSIRYGNGDTVNDTLQAHG